MNGKFVAIVFFVLGALLVWFRYGGNTGDGPAPPPPARPAASAAPAPAAAASGPSYPIQPTDKPVAAAEIPSELASLLGAKAVAGFLLTDDFARRFAATVDNLGREHAAVALWPVQPTPGRFTTEDSGSGPVIAAGNEQRYLPFVQFVESVDVARAVQLYARMYPVLQAAYVKLGYPKREFNDRLVNVIDQLLATPRPAYPIALRLAEVKGPVPSERPWVRFQFADPALEQLSAGQKIMLRVGPDNQRRLRNRLAQIRAQLTAPR
jgi:hypothetical protein